MKQIDAQRVQQLKLFRDMDEDAFQKLTAGAFMQKFPTGTTLLYEGDRVDFLYMLFDGTVELQGTWNEKETTVALLRPLSMFILSSVVLDAPALMSARTLERSELLMLPAEALRRFMREDGRFAVAVAEEMAGWNRSLVRQVKNVKLRTSSERLANYLLQLQIHQRGERVLHLRQEKRVLASLLGMTPENLSRAFSVLADYGVRVNGQEVDLTMPTALKRLAKPSPLIDNHMPPPPGLSGKAERELWPPREGLLPPGRD